MTIEELREISELKNYTYIDYATNQPMRDGKEIRDFFDDLNERNGNNEILHSK